MYSDTVPSILKTHTKPAAVTVPSTVFTSKKKEASIAVDDRGGGTGPADPATAGPMF